MTSPNILVHRHTRSSRIAIVVALLLVFAIPTMPFWASSGHIRLIVELSCLIAIAQMWNLLAGYGGMVSVGQQAFIGAGGYSRALLEAGARVYAFDRDPYAIEEGAADEAHYAGRLSLHPHRFSLMHKEMQRMGVPQVDAVVMDIGVSSMQLDQGDRGFAFMHDGPLDMRMSQAGESAADFLNTAEEEAIANVLYRYGEERQSRRVMNMPTAPARAGIRVKRAVDASNILHDIYVVGNRRFTGFFQRGNRLALRSVITKGNNRYASIVIICRNPDNFLNIVIRVGWLIHRLFRFRDIINRRLFCQLFVG